MKKASRIIIVTCTILFLFSGCNRQCKIIYNDAVKETALFLDIENSIDSLLNIQYLDGKINGNVLVTKKGKTLYENSFGYTDGSKKSLLTKDFRFNIGSVFKEFPAVAIMQLSESKLIHLDDKIASYLPELPKWSEEISIKNLLQYSSGLPRIQWGEYFGKGLPITDEGIIKDLMSVDSLQFVPGTDYLYTNYSPILLIKIIESVTAIQFNEYIKANLLLPFKLNGTILKDKYPYSDITNMAIPFNSDGENDGYRLSISNILLSCTASDMQNWFTQLDDFKIVSKESVKFLSKTAISGDNIQAPLGYSEWENNELIEHAHHGSSGNYECFIQHFKADNLIIVIMTNQKQKNVHEMSNNIYNIVQKK